MDSKLTTHDQWDEAVTVLTASQALSAMSSSLSKGKKNLLYFLVLGSHCLNQTFPWDDKLEHTQKRAT